jgi:pimeloyl-ACP methyl ester carboxylesterase
VSTVLHLIGEERRDATNTYSQKEKYTTAEHLCQRRERQTTIDSEEEQRDVPYRANAPELFGDPTMPTYQITPADLAEIRVPCLVVRGNASDPMFRVIAGILAERIPHAQLVELDNCCHVTYAEQCEACAAAVEAFVRNFTLEPRRAHTHANCTAKDVSAWWQSEEPVAAIVAAMR